MPISLFPSTVLRFKRVISPLHSPLPWHTAAPCSCRAFASFTPLHSHALIKKTCHFLFFFLPFQLFLPEKPPGSIQEYIIARMRKQTPAVNPGQVLTAHGAMLQKPPDVSTFSPWFPHSPILNPKVIQDKNNCNLNSVPLEDPACGWESSMPPSLERL